MRVLFISGTFPNALEPTKGTFNGQTVRALARSHEVVVVAPVSWRDASQGIRCAAATFVPPPDNGCCTRWDGSPHRWMR